MFELRVLRRIRDGGTRKCEHKFLLCICERTLVPMNASGGSSLADHPRQQTRCFMFQRASSVQARVN